MNITKWNEINSATLEYLMTCYRRNEEWTLGTVIEIQNPVALMKGESERRLYLGGRTLNEDFDSFRDFEQPYLKLLESIKEQGRIEEDNTESLCFCVLEEKNPTIIPIFMHTNYQYLMFQITGDLFGSNDFGCKTLVDAISDFKENKWYIKEGGINKVDLREFAFRFYEPKERLYRIRTINYEVWKKNILSFIGGDKLKYTETDEKFVENKMLVETKQVSQETCNKIRDIIIQVIKDKFNGEVPNPIEDEFFNKINKHLDCQLNINEFEDNFYYFSGRNFFILEPENNIIRFQISYMTKQAIFERSPILAEKKDVWIEVPIKLKEEI